jgi:hypothetical protein
MLIQAAECGFRRVEGVEFCEKLSQQAKQNLDIYQKKCNPRSLLTVHHLDATEFEFPPEPLVLFFFNAFQGAALKKVLKNLDRSLKEFPRNLFFFWNGPDFYPESIKIMEGCNSLKLHTRQKDFVIYRNSDQRPTRLSPHTIATQFLTVRPTVRSSAFRRRRTPMRSEATPHVPHPTHPQPIIPHLPGRSPPIRTFQHLPGTDCRYIRLIPQLRLTRVIREKPPHAHSHPSRRLTRRLRALGENP